MEFWWNSSGTAMEFSPSWKIRTQALGFPASHPPRMTHRPLGHPPGQKPGEWYNGFTIGHQRSLVDQMKLEHKRALRCFILEKLGEVKRFDLLNLAEQHECHPFDIAQQFEVEINRIERLFNYPNYSD
jgi:hypothetical protein